MSEDNNVKNALLSSSKLNDADCEITQITSSQPDKLQFENYEPYQLSIFNMYSRSRSFCTKVVEQLKNTILSTFTTNHDHDYIMRIFNMQKKEYPAILDKILKFAVTKNDSQLTEYK